MNCTKCGAPLHGAAFCAACGTPADSNTLSANATPATTFVTPQVPLGAPMPKTNGLAIASFVTSLVGSFCGIGFLGIVFGIIALSQIRKSNGMQLGSGMAIAGIVIGALSVLGYLAFFTSIATLTSPVIELT